MRIKTTTKRQMVLQINQARERLIMFRRKGWRAQYSYLKKWINTHKEMCGL